MNHTISLLESYVRSFIAEQEAASPKGPPAFIALQGPQGIGKTTLTRALQTELAKPPHPLRIVVLGLDDFYLPHSGLLARAQEHSTNKLLQGRGQPGTHDLPLLCGVLRQLSQLNEKGGKVAIPLFDKSLNEGRGDRSTECLEIEGRVDAVILEGWCVGFYPLMEENLRVKYQSLVLDATKDEISSNAEEQLARQIVRRYTFEDIQTVNAYLREYAQEIYPFFNGFIQLSPPPLKPYTVIYKWRLQQEHDMKRANGGFGMSDSQVKDFIDRYISGYVFFRFGVEEGWVGFSNEREKSKGYPSWKGRALRIVMDEDRPVVESSRF